MNHHKEIDEKRDHECLECKHKWTSKVVFSAVTSNLSGEKTEWCPKCGTKNAMSGPAY